MAFAVPADATSLMIHNFDAASGEVWFASTYRTVELAASGQDEWRESTVELLPEERGATAAIVASGGQEIPNDLTLFVTDGAGRLLPMRLPATAALPDARPVPVADHAPLADCSGLAFDASRSTDPDGDRLHYSWEFGDGASAEGVAVVHRYPAPGIYGGMLRVLDGSPQIGNGAELPFEVHGQAAAHGDGRAGRGGGTGRGRRLRRQRLDPRRPPDRRLQLGLPGRHPGVRVQPGARIRALRPLCGDAAGPDDRPGACDSSADQVVVDVNAAPVAVAGPERHVATGETVKLDGGRSYDVDGQITGWAWDLGDGTTAQGRR